MPPKRNQPVAQAKRGRQKTAEVETVPPSSNLLTPVRKNECNETELPSVVTA